jgi:hypothetical protein
MRVGKRVPGGTLTMDEWGRPAGGLPIFGGGGGGGDAGPVSVTTGMTTGTSGWASRSRVPGASGAGVMTTLPPFGGGGGYGGGGGRGGVGAGQGFATYAPDDGKRISSDRDGTTVARVNPGADPYTGLDGLHGYKRKPLAPLPTSGSSYGGHVASGEGFWNGVPMAAEGGALPPLQPFIAGDPQRNGKPNPELIVPLPDGRTHVIPLQDLGELPKLGDGTVSKRVDGRTVPTKGAPKPLGGLEQFYVNNPHTPNAAQAEFAKKAGVKPAEMMKPLAPLPVTVPKKAYGTVEAIDAEDSVALPPGFREAWMAHETDPNLLARDASGNIVGFSSGVPSTGTLPPLMSDAAPLPDLIPVSELPAGSRVPAVRNPVGPLPPMPSAPNPYFANPEGIEVGVTPRAPLTRLEPLDAMSDDERFYARLERDQQREARRDPRVRDMLLNQRAGSIEAQNAARARMAMAMFTQDNVNTRHQAVIDAANTRFETTRKGQADAAARTEQEKREAMVRNLLNNAVVATNLQMQGKLPAQQAMNIMTMTDPTQQDTLLKSAAYNTPASQLNGASDSVSLRPLPQWGGAPMRLPELGSSRPPQGGASFPQVSSTPLTPPQGQAPLMPMSPDMEMVPVEASVTTGKPTRYEARPKAKEKLDHAERMKLIDELDKVEKKVQALDVSPSAKTRYEALKKAIESDLDGDGVVTPAEARATAVTGAAGSAVRALLERVLGK